MPDPGGSPRIAALDGLRGIAVMGILLMNITAFALPEGAYFNPAALGPATDADLAVWAATALLVDGKMRALFSLLFGASMLLVIERVDEGGGDGLRVHVRRMAVLMAFGLAHAWLVWWGDILFHYAAVGLVACLFAHRDAAALVRIAVGCIALQLVIGLSVVAGIADLRAAAGAPGAAAATVDAWLDLSAVIGVPTPDRLAAELALWRGPYAGIVRELAVARGTDPLVLLWSGGAETLGLMLLGMAGLRSGFLSGGWSRAAYARAARWGYGIGLPATALLLAADVRSGFDTVTVFGTSYLGGTLARLPLVLGHASLALLWLTAGEGGLRARVIAAGRCAFSNYLGTSIAMTAIFYGWGLGLFGSVGRAPLMLVVVAAWGVMLAWSQPWLARHPYGPLEWLWRSLARGAVQPWRSAGAGR